MARYGVDISNALGIGAPSLRRLAREIGKDHPLALKLWNSGIHEARILASLIDDPKLVTEQQMDFWVNDFYSWDIRDSCCGNLFKKTPFAYRKAIEWSGSEQEYIKRAGFAMMAVLALNRRIDNSQFDEFLPIIIENSTDERNFVKKAVNWALRQIGKRNPECNKKAIKVAEDIHKLDSRSARWIAADALRELRSDSVQDRLRKRY
jgi:3-methyladenine DNA glycosylase AlkD